MFASTMLLLLLLPCCWLAHAQELDASLDCVDACSFLAPSHCFDDAVNGSGGCCGRDDAGPGRVSTTGPDCQSCQPSGSHYEWLCSKCHQDSKCYGLDRVARDEAVCKEHSCVDGCLKDGHCNHTVLERDCVYDLDSVWCLPCDKDLWDICYVATYCYEPCNGGCCSSECGTCPSPPFQMRQWGQDCAGCAMVPPMCDECFPRSVCSDYYNPEHGQPEQYDGTRECTTSPPTTGAPTTIQTAPSTSVRLTTEAVIEVSSGVTTTMTDGIARVSAASAPSAIPDLEVNASRKEYEDDDEDMSCAWLSAKMGSSLLLMIVGLSL